MFGENLKTLRKQKGFSQEELATRLHVVRQTISKWEKFICSRRRYPYPIGWNIGSICQRIAGGKNWKWKYCQWCRRAVIKDKWAACNQKSPLTPYLENRCHYIGGYRFNKHFHCRVFQRSKPQWRHSEQSARDNRSNTKHRGMNGKASRTIQR